MKFFNIATLVASGAMGIIAAANAINNHGIATLIYTTLALVLLAVGAIRVVDL